MKRRKHLLATTSVKAKTNAIGRPLPILGLMFLLYTMSCKVRSAESFNKLQESPDGQLQFSGPYTEDWRFTRSVTYSDFKVSVKK